MSLMLLLTDESIVSSATGLNLSRNVTGSMRVYVKTVTVLRYTISSRALAL